MSIINTIKAIFTFHGQKMQVEVLSARIKRGVARLRAFDSHQEYEVQAKNITILIDNEDDESVQVVEPPDSEGSSDDDHKNPDDKQKKPTPTKPGKTNRKRPATIADLTLEKKSFATGFYESERMEIVSAYKSAKAKRDEYLLACVRAASPRKIEQELKRIRRERETMQEQDNADE